MDVLEPMKAELEMMRLEKLCMEATLIFAESVLAEMKRVLSEYKVIENFADELLLDIFIEAGTDNVHENNIQNLDEETMNSLIEEAMKEFTEAVNEAQSSRKRPADCVEGGGCDGSTDDITILNLDHGTNVNTTKDGHKGGNHGTGPAE